MFKERPRDDKSDVCSGFDEGRTLDLWSIIEESIDLPPAALRTDFSHVNDRTLDQKTCSRLTNPPSSNSDAHDLSERYRHRQEALTPYLGKRLICVCIRLPGVAYTIEIDPEAETVIHWEWQSV
jgi:hypothetical protein